MGRYIKGIVEESLGLGTLASLTLVGAQFDEAVTERTLISSLVAAYSMAEFTESTGDGPIIVGIAHSDYTDAEIEAWLESVASWSEADKVGQEIGNRLCRTIGTFPSAPQVGQPSAVAVLNDGKPIKTKLNWILDTGQTLRLWAYNTGSSPLAGTAPVIKCVGHANLWPK